MPEKIDLSMDKYIFKYICTFVDKSLAMSVSSLLSTVTASALQSSSLAPCFKRRSTTGTSRLRQASTRPVDCP